MIFTGVTQFENNHILVYGLPRFAGQNRFSHAMTNRFFHIRNDNVWCHTEWPTFGINYKNY